MPDMEKVIKGLETCAGTNNDGDDCTADCLLDCPYKGSLCIDRLMYDALTLLKERDNWLGIHQTVDGITCISSGTAKQGEKRGIMLGKALVYERLEKELQYRGLLTDDIRSAFVKVWGELE